MDGEGWMAPGRGVGGDREGGIWKGATGKERWGGGNLERGNREGEMGRGRWGGGQQGGGDGEAGGGDGETERGEKKGQEKGGFHRWIRQTARVDMGVGLIK